MTLYYIQKMVSASLEKGSEFTSYELANKIWPDFYRSPHKPTLHPMSAQVSIVLKDFPNVVRDKKTKKYKVI